MQTEANGRTHRRRLWFCGIVSAIWVSILFLVSGCGGQNPARMAAYEALSSSWDVLHTDAELGVQVREEPNLAEAVGVQPISPGLAADRRRAMEHGRLLLEWLMMLERGELTGDEPLPSLEVGITTGGD